MDENMEDVDKRVEWLHSEQSSVAGNIFGEPLKTTRIGDEYQAKIPSLMTKNEQELSLCHVAKTDVRLPNPVMWVHHQHKNKEETMEIQANSNNDLVPMHCSPNQESWSKIEHESFLLGLYIFGKNLGVVNKFIGNKGMPNLLRYYYGKFYRSGEHQKWSMYRKKRSRMSMPGKRVFSGWRQHELLSRLLPNVTDECKSSLTQVVRAFEEGKLSLEKYVFTLRDIVGINLLTKSIAIGKGKQDLISRTKGILKHKKVKSTCASLTTEEIVGSLKDRIGLSKAGLNDLFWEVVWPRLLARGWHSEQPKNYAVQNIKNSFVFLAPGVAKFSRRSLEKGSQYFDSFTDVLNKVASEPHLLDHQPDMDPLVKPHGKHDPDDEQDSMKYTIVDTSLVGLVKVRNLTSLSVSEAADTHPMTSVSEESQKEDVNCKRLKVCEMANNLDPNMKMDDGRKLKLVFKPIIKRQRANNIRNRNACDENEHMEKAFSAKKRAQIVIDLTSPRVGPGSDDDNSLSSANQSVLTETTTANQTELLNAGTNGQRQSTRNRALTKKAMEALANDFLNPRKRRRGSEDGSRTRVGGKTALITSCGGRYIDKIGGVSV